MYTSRQIYYVYGLFTNQNNLEDIPGNVIFINSFIFIIYYKKFVNPIS